MKKNIVLVSCVIGLLLSVGCSKKVDQSSKNIEQPKTEVQTLVEGTNIDNKQKSSPEATVHQFIEALQKNDVKSIRESISPSGVVVIRSFVTGNGERGADIRSTYSKNSITDKFSFSIGNETPIELKSLFKNAIEKEKDKIRVSTIKGKRFNFKDSTTNDVREPLTSSVWDVTGHIESNFEKNSLSEPRITILDDKEVVLSEQIGGFGTGNWAVFEQVDGKYFLRSIMEFR